MKKYNIISASILLFIITLNSVLIAQDERDVITPLFSCSIRSGIEPLLVEFTDQSTVQFGFWIDSWHWDFGDGNTSTEPNPIHIYTAIDSHTVSLTVWDDIGYQYTITKEKYIFVHAPPPVTDFSASVESGPKPLEVQFTDLSYDTSSGYNINYHLWDFGDGTSSIEQNPSHVYTEIGIYNVILSVGNDGLGYSSETKMDYITVLDVPPISGFDKALGFDGENDYLHVASDLGNLSAMTLEFWFKKPDINAGAQYLFDARSDGNWWFLQDYTPGYCTNESICFNDRVKIDGADISDNAWYHVAVTVTSSEAKIYLNGELKDTGGSGDSPEIGSGLRFGTRYTTADYFEGSIDEVRIWNLVRTQAEIEENVYRRLEGDEVGLKLYWNMDQIEDNILPDITNNANNGTLEGMDDFPSNLHRSIKIVYNVDENSSIFLPVQGFSPIDNYILPFIYEEPVLGSLEVADPSQFTFHYETPQNDLNADRLALSFNYDNTDEISGISTSGDILFTYKITDGYTESEQDTGLLRINPINDAPVVLNPDTVLQFFPVLSTNTDPTGMSVSDLIENLNIHDPDNIYFDYTNDTIAYEYIHNDGIAITAIDNTHGHWQYKIGNDWSDIAEGLLLNGDASIRLKPVLNQGGDSEIHFRVWDRSMGSSGDVVDLSTTGGITPYGNEDVTAEIEIIDGPPVAGFGHAFSFDGEDDFISNESVATGIDWDSASGVTIEAWINPAHFGSNDATGYSLLTFYDEENDDIKMAIGITPEKKLFWWPANDDPGHIHELLNPEIQIGEWQHVALTIDYSNNNHVTLFLNEHHSGGSSYTSSGPTSKGCTEFGIGTNHDHSFLVHYNGAMDDVRVWNYARSHSEITDNMYTNYTSSETGLVAYYRFNENGVNEQGNIVTADDSGNEYDGILQNGIVDNWLKSYTWQSNRELYFNHYDRSNFITLKGKYLNSTTNSDGKTVEGDYIEADGVAQALQGSDTYTIAIWVYPNINTTESGQNSDNQIWSFHTDDYSNIGGLSYGTIGDAETSSKFHLWGLGTENTWTDISYSPNNWYHIALSVDGTNATLYVNGYLDSSIGGASNELSLTDAAYFSIGQEWDSPHTSQHFEGSLSSFYVWNRSLDLNEINAVMVDTITASGLIAYYPLNEGSGSIAYDNSGNGNNGDIYISPKREIIPLAFEFSMDEDGIITDQLPGYDLDSEVVLTYGLIGNSDNGNINLVPSSGEITYTPDPNYNGIDFIEYSVTDNGGNADSTIIYVTINPVNDAPNVTNHNVDMMMITQGSDVPITNPVSANYSQGLVSFLTSDIGEDVDLPHYANFSDNVGIAVTYVFNPIGEWKYCTDCKINWDQATWSVIEPGNGPHPIETNALLLGPNDRIAFDPDTSLHVDTTAIVHFRIWDMTDGNSSGDRIDVSQNGGTTAYSADEVVVFEPVVLAFVINIPEIDFPFLALTDGSGEYRLELSDSFSMFGFELDPGGSQDSLILEWTQITSESGKFTIHGAAKFNIDMDEFDNDLQIVLGNSSDPVNNPGLSFHYIHNSSLTIDSVHMEITESFSYDGFTFTTADMNGDGAPDPISFDYNYSDKQLEMTGGASFSYDDASGRTSDNLTVYFMDNEDSSKPGLIIKDNVLQYLELTTDATFDIFGLDFRDDGLSFKYIPAESKLSMWGGVELIMPDLGDADLSVSLGDSDSPGLYFYNGQLEHLNADINFAFQSGGFQFHEKDLIIEYTADPNVEFTISGETEIDLTSGLTIDIHLGTSTVPGIIVNAHDPGDDTITLEAFSVEITSLELGAIDFKDAKFTYENDNEDYQFSADLKVSFPPGWEVDADMSFEYNTDVDPHLFQFQDLSLDWCVVGDEPGIEIPGTGLDIVRLGATVDNLDDPSNLTVSGACAVVLADQFSFDEREVTLLRVDGNVTISSTHLTMNDMVYLGAYQTESNPNCETPWHAALAQAEVELYLNWANNYYYVSGELDIPSDPGFIFTDKLWMKNSSMGLLSEAEVIVPSDIDVIGGMNLGEIGFGTLLKYGSGSSPSLKSGSFFAAWTHIFIIGNVGVELEKSGSSSSSTMDFSFLGSSAVSDVQTEAGGSGRDNLKITKNFNIGSLEYITGITAKLHWNQPLSPWTSHQAPAISLTSSLGDNVDITSGQAVYIDSIFQFVHLDSLSLSDTDTSMLMVIGSEQFIQHLSDNDEDQSDLVSLPPGTKLTLHFTYPQNGNPNITLGIEPRVHYRNPWLTVESGTVTSDSIELLVNYWVAPHMLDYSKIYFYVDLDTATMYDGLLFDEGLQTDNYNDDVNVGGSFSIWFKPGSISNTSISHSVFKPYYFYASIHDTTNKPVYSISTDPIGTSYNYTEPTFIVPPIYGQVLDSAYHGLKNIVVFVDVDRDGFFTSHEEYTDLDSSGHYTLEEDFVDLNNNNVWDSIVDIPDLSDEFGSFAFHGVELADTVEIGIVVPYNKQLAPDSPSEDGTIIIYNGNSVGLFFYIEEDNVGEQ